MLKRYTHLRPEHLYRDKARRPAEDMAEVVRAAVRSLASELHVSPAQQHSPAEAKADMLQEAAPLLRQLAALLLDQDSPPPSAPPPSARRSEEHTSELQSLMRISYAVFCLKKKNKKYSKLHTTD